MSAAGCLQHAPAGQAADPLPPPCADPLACRVWKVEGSWVELDREVPFGIAAGWRGSLHRYAPTLQDAGVEKLTIEFE